MFAKATELRNEAAEVKRHVLVSVGVAVQVQGILQIVCHGLNR